VVRCACAPGLDGTRGGTVVDHVRLFPLRPGVRWSYRVHEQILPSLKRLKVAVRWNLQEALRTCAEGLRSSTARMPNCGSARRWCTGIEASEPKPSGAGG
jgi:hypothetical protein